MVSVDTQAEGSAPGGYSNSLAPPKFKAGQAQFVELTSTAQFMSCLGGVWGEQGVKLATTGRCYHGSKCPESYLQAGTGTGYGPSAREGWIALALAKCVRYQQ